MLQILLGLTLASLASLPALAQNTSSEVALRGIAQLDEITGRFKTIDAFLADTAAVDEYYHASVGYYGGETRFSRKPFDIILEQTRKLIDAYPELKPLLWSEFKSSSLSPGFSIEADIKSSGRGLNAETWNAYLLELKSQNAETAAALGDSPIAILDKTNELHARILKDLEALPSKDRSAYYERLRNDPELDRLGAYYANEILESERVRDAFGTQDADVVLNLIKAELQGGNLSSYLRPDYRHFHSMILDAIKKRLPNLRSNLNDLFPIKIEEVWSRRRNEYIKFPTGAGAKQIRFITPRKRFHRLFAGIPIGECVGGGIDHLESLTPFRYMSFLASDDSHVFFGEKGASSLGFIEIVSGTIEGKTYGNPLLAVAELSKTGYIRDGAVARRIPLWKLVWQKLIELKPQDWQQYAIANFMGADNSQVHVKIYDDVAFAVSPMGKHDTFQIDTRWADRIKEVVPASDRLSRAYSWRAGFILDATVPGVSPVLLEDPSWSEQQHLERILTSIQRDPGMNRSQAVLHLIKDWKTKGRILERKRLFGVEPDHSLQPFLKEVESFEWLFGQLAVEDRAPFFKAITSSVGKKFLQNHFGDPHGFSSVAMHRYFDLGLPADNPLLLQQVARDLADGKIAYSQSFAKKVFSQETLDPAFRLEHLLKIVRNHAEDRTLLTSDHLPLFASSSGSEVIREIENWIKMASESDFVKRVPFILKGSRYENAIVTRLQLLLKEGTIGRFTPFDFDDRDNPGFWHQLSAKIRRAIFGYQFGLASPKMYKQGYSHSSPLLQAYLNIGSWLGENTTHRQWLENMALLFEALDARIDDLWPNKEHINYFFIENFHSRIYNHPLTEFDPVLMDAIFKSWGKEKLRGLNGLYYRLARNQFQYVAPDQVKPILLYFSRVLPPKEAREVQIEFTKRFPESVTISICPRHFSLQN